MVLTIIIAITAIWIIGALITVCSMSAEEREDAGIDLGGQGR